MPSSSDAAEGEAPSNEDVLETTRRDEFWLQERLAFEELPHNKIDVPATTQKWDAAVLQCKDDLENAAEELRKSKSASDKYDKWPEWRKRAEPNHDGWKWRSVRDRGQRLWDTHKAVCFRVSLESYTRALRIVNALALAAPARGFSVREDEAKGRIVFSGHEAEVQLRLTELLERKTRPSKRYDGTIEQEEYMVPTGRLRISLDIDYREGPYFVDHDSQPLERQLNVIYCRIYKLVVKARQADRELKAFRRRLDEEERQRVLAIEAKAQQELALTKERARQQHLSDEANSWAQSVRIRDYVNHIRTSNFGGTELSPQLVEWTTWAISVADALDPTSRRRSHSARE